MQIYGRNGNLAMVSFLKGKFYFFMTVFAVEIFVKKALFSPIINLLKPFNFRTFAGIQF